MSKPRKIHVITGGIFHDFNRARLTLLQLMAEDDSLHATCADDFSYVDRLDDHCGIVIYGCDLIPDEAETRALSRFVERGGRLLALHATNAQIRFTDGPAIRASGVDIPGLVRAPGPEVAPEYMALLGSRFQAHLALQDFTVNVVDPDHEMTRGLEDFMVSDEPYVSTILTDVRVLLSARYKGDAPGYELGHFESDEPRPQLYVRNHGRGEVMYFTLGHAFGRYDLAPMIAEVEPVIGPWENEHFLEILRRGLQWLAKGSSSSSGS